VTGAKNTSPLRRTSDGLERVGGERDFGPPEGRGSEHRRPDDEVLIVELGNGASPARAYPIRILNYHEVVNDTVPVADGDVASIAVTWCPTCGSGGTISCTSDNAEAKRDSISKPAFFASFICPFVNI